MAKKYPSMSEQELKSLQADLIDKYNEFKSKALSLDMQRGKPCKEQVDLSEGMLTILDTNSKCYSGKTDIRNYGMLDGIPEIKTIFAEMLEVSPVDIICGGNSSLNMMFDSISRAMNFGVLPGYTPWCKSEEIKFLCPVPGYDRHFAICEVFGINMIPVPMTSDGPDMDIITDLVENDPSVKGVWCVPKYSNPEGIVYSDETVKRFASLKPAAPDFRIYWDNAYAVHDLYEKIPLLDIFGECRKCGSKNLVYEFASTSKISFPGSGVACVVADKDDILWAKKLIAFQTIGPDKINQLRHAEYFKNMDGIYSHMEKHAAIMRPKFEIVTKVFNEELSDLGICRWSEPKGGYFISFDITTGSASKALELAADAGVAMTPAGSTFPYHFDPNDRNVRIAPSFPSVEELETACRLFSLCVKLAAVEKLLN